MNTLLSLFIFVIFMSASFMCFFFTPFFKNKFQKWITLGLIIFTFIMIIIPTSIIGKLPFIDGTIENFIRNFLNSSSHFESINDIAPLIEENILISVEKIIKMCIVFYANAVVIMLATIALLIVQLFKSIKNFFKAFGISIVTFVLCAIMIIAPTYSIVKVTNAINVNLTENGSFYNTYPEYKKYKNVFDFIESIDENLFKNTSIFNKSDELTKFITSGHDKILIKDLNQIQSLLEQVGTSGITVIYTDENFDFSKTTQETFDFSELDSLINNVLKSKTFGDIARGFTNEILEVFEEEIKKDTNTDKFIYLRLSQEEFTNQYKGIIKMLKFVVDYDLVEYIKDLSYDNLVALVQKLGFEGITDLLDIINTPIIKQIKKYTNKLTNAEAAIYACIRLYDVLNIWLGEYKETSLYNTTIEFLKTRGIL